MSQYTESFTFNDVTIDKIFTYVERYFLEHGEIRSIVKESDNRVSIKVTPKSGHRGLDLQLMAEEHKGGVRVDLRGGQSVMNWMQFIAHGVLMVITGFFWSPIAIWRMIASGSNAKKLLDGFNSSLRLKFD